MEPVLSASGLGDLQGRPNRIEVALVLLIGKPGHAEHVPVKRELVEKASQRLYEAWRSEGRRYY